LPRDLANDAHDSLSGSFTALNGQAGENLGWAVPTAGTPLTLRVPGVSNVARAVAGLLTFNYYMYNPVTLSYSLNGNAWHTVPWPSPDKLTYTWRTLAVPVSLSEVVQGTNTIQFKSTDGTIIANVDLIMAGAGGTVAPK